MVYKNVDHIQKCIKPLYHTIQKIMIGYLKLWDNANDNDNYDNIRNN